MQLLRLGLEGLWDKCSRPPTDGTAGMSLIKALTSPPTLKVTRCRSGLQAALGGAAYQDHPAERQTRNLLGGRHQDVPPMQPHSRPW